MFQIPAKPRFAVIGPGALGSYYAGRLVQHGHDVHFLLRSDYDAVREQGLRIESRDGDFTLSPGQLHLYRRPEDMPPADVVLVALKTTANSHFPELITPVLQPDACILTLQNGLGNEEQLATLFGQERILGGLCFVCINRISPGHIRHTDHGLIKIGEFNRPPTPRLLALRDIFRACKVRCETLDDLALGRWEKLIWNVPFNGLGAALGLATDRIVNNPEGLALVRSLMQEVVNTARAAGVPLDEHLIDQNIRRTLTMGSYRSSMQIDRELGRPIELEAIIGEPLRVAQSFSVLAPNLQMLYRLLAITSQR